MKYLICLIAFFLTAAQFASLQGMEPAGRIVCEICNRRAIEQQEQDERTALVFEYSPLHKVFACQKRELPYGLLRYRRQVQQLRSTAPRVHDHGQSSSVKGVQEVTVKRQKPSIDDL